MGFTGVILQSSITKEQSNRIQMIRGIAIIMVVITHTVLWNPYEIYIKPFVNPAVAIFIFLSGLLTNLELNKQEIKSFYKRRLLRVFIPYTLWSVVYVIYSGDYSNAILNYFTGNCCSIFYYLFVYMQLVLVTPLLMYLMKSKLKWIGYLASGIVILVEYFLAFNNVTLVYPYNINNLFVWVSFYFLGLNMGNGTVIIKNYTKKTCIVGIVLLVVAYIFEIIEALGWKEYGRYDIATSQLKISTMMSSMVLCILLYGVIICKKRYKYRSGYIKNILVYIGGCSFGIYLMHQLVILIWNDYLYKYRLDIFVWFIIETIVVVIICIIVISLGRMLSGKKIGKYIGLY